MSYQVLARKWRPRNFEDMVGQETVLRMLTNALTQKRLHHAYLFTGTRGVGKTTLARILAKCLNCETGITAIPCGRCHACQSIDQGQFLDLYEVDAASRTKVEDTRELLENVLYPPSQGRYKIYLIDEVHMLSNHSFNALLKTLEEPPAHVKFLLATTDPKRLPITILSRCLQFHLKRITTAQIATYLQHICEIEKIANDVPAFQKLAQAADGSMRDALSLLDQAIAYGLGSVNKQNVDAMLGSMPYEDLLPLLEALARKEGKQLFDAITKLAERAPDFQLVLEEIIHILHKVAIAQIAPETIKLEEHVAFLTECFSAEEIQLYYQIALLGRRDLALTPTPQQGFEMTMLRMFAFKPHDESNHGSRLATIEADNTKPADIESTSIKRANIETTKSPTISSPTAPILPKSISPQKPSESNKEEWRLILPKLELSGMAYALASNCILVHINEDKVELALSLNHQPMLSQKLKERITEALSRYYKRPIQLDINMTSAELSTPIKQQQHEEKQQLKNATQSIMQDPHIKKLIEMYDATVDVSLLA